MVLALARQLLEQHGEGSRDSRRRVALQQVIGYAEDPAALRRVTLAVTRPQSDDAT